MDTTTFTITSTDGEEVFVYRWSGDGEPKAVVQIAHGMGEHAARYARLAEALVDEGYVVYANDHRGHGRTAGSADRHGDLGSGGWSGLVDDMSAVTAQGRGRSTPGIPLVLLGHSMGSFALQQYLLDRSGDIDAAVLSGTTAVDVIAAGIDTSQPADLSAFNAAFEPARTEYDWLSRDEAEVDPYVADPACGFGVDQRRDGPDDGRRRGPRRRRAARPRSAPTCRSTCSPATPTRSPAAARWSRWSPTATASAGVKDVTVRLYPDARHETLNETNRDEVTADLIAWLGTGHDGLTAGFSR